MEKRKPGPRPKAERDKVTTMSFSCPKEIAEFVRQRADELGHSLAAYFSMLVRNEMGAIAQHEQDVASEQESDN